MVRYLLFSNKNQLYFSLLSDEMTDVAWWFYQIYCKILMKGLYPYWTSNFQPCVKLNFFITMPYLTWVGEIWREISPSVFPLDSRQPGGWWHEGWTRGTCRCQDQPQEDQSRLRLMRRIRRAMWGLCWIARGEPTISCLASKSNQIESRLLEVILRK